MQKTGSRSEFTVGNRHRVRGRLGALIAAVALLSGCAGLPTGEPLDPSSPNAAVAAHAPSNSKETPFPPGVMLRLLTAELEVRRGQPAKAVETYLTVADETRDAGVAERATRMAVYARDQEAGLKASKLWVDVANTREAHRVYAALLIRAGRGPESVAQLKYLVRTYGVKENGGYGTVVQLLNRERDKDRRISLMEQVVAEETQDPKAQAALAQVLAQGGQAPRALEIMKQVHRDHPEDGNYAAFYASLLRADGKTEEGLAVLANQVKNAPEDQDARMVYARFLVSAKRYEEARAQFEKLAVLDPDRVDVRYALGLLLLQTNHHDDARVHFEKLVQLGERSLHANYYLGQIAEAKKEKEKAITYYRRVDRGEQYLDAQIRVAAIYADLGKLDRAQQHLSAVRRSAAQDDLRLYRAEAELLARHDRLDDAIKIFDSALEAHPKNNDLLYARAMMAARAEQFDKMERDLRDILTREPNNADALNALGYTLADRDERLDEAYDLIKKAYALKPKDHYIIDSLGWVLYRLGRLEEAAKHLRVAMDLKPDAEVAAHLGEVLWVLGRKKEAREVWDTALKERPNDKRLLETINRLSK